MRLSKDLDEVFPKLARNVFDVQALPMLEEIGPVDRSRVRAISSHVTYRIRYRVKKKQ